MFSRDSEQYIKILSKSKQISYRVTARAVKEKREFLDVPLNIFFKEIYLVSYLPLNIPVLYKGPCSYVQYYIRTCGLQTGGGG